MKLISSDNNHNVKKGEKKVKKERSTNFLKLYSYLKTKNRTSTSAFLNLILVLSLHTSVTCLEMAYSLKVLILMMSDH